MTQNDAVIQTMESLGGIATLGQLNQEVFKIKECEWKTKTPFASIRRIVQLHKEIYKIKPGLYALQKYKSILEKNGFIQETEQNKDSQAIKESDHYYYQGVLLEIGNMRQFNTYVPNQDKNKKYNLKQTLGELRSLEEIPHFSYDSLVQRSSSIDVIWFNERIMPDSFFEVEHSTDIQNSLLKFDSLQDFNTRMIIVADEKRHQEYKKKLEYSSFKDIKKRVNFLSYENLIKQYDMELTKQDLGFVL